MQCPKCGWRGCFILSVRNNHLTNRREESRRCINCAFLYVVDMPIPETTGEDHRPRRDEAVRKGGAL